MNVHKIISRFCCRKVAGQEISVASPAGSIPATSKIKLDADTRVAVPTIIIHVDSARDITVLVVMVVLLIAVRIRDLSAVSEDILLLCNCLADAEQQNAKPQRR
jgi:hypothetical protein